VIDTQQRNLKNTRRVVVVDSIRALDAMVKDVRDSSPIDINGSSVNNDSNGLRKRNQWHVIGLHRDTTEKTFE
jgi:hypothetical protein